MHRLITAFILCLCLAFGALSALAMDTTGWTKAEFLSASFLYPPDFEVMDEGDEGVGVGKVDHQTNEGVAFGLVKDTREYMIKDIQRDAATFEEAGPYEVGGQKGTLYKATMNQEGMAGQMEMIILNTPFPDGDSLVVMQVVMNLDWRENEPLLKAMRSSMVIDPAMFRAEGGTAAPVPPVLPGLQGMPGPQVQAETPAEPAPATPSQTPAQTPPGLPAILAPQTTPTPAVQAPAVQAPAVQAPAVSTDTSGWVTVERMGCSYRYPPEFQVLEDEDDGIVVGAMDQATKKGTAFGLGKDDAEDMIKDMKKESDSFEELGPVTIAGQSGRAYLVTKDQMDEGMTGKVRVYILDQAFPDGDQLMILQVVTNEDWETKQALFDAILDTVVIDPAVYTAQAEPQDGVVQPSAYREGAIVLKDARSYRDAVGRGEKLEPDGAPDARFILTIHGPGVVTDVRLHNMDGIHSEWDTMPGNGNWAMAVYKGRDLVSNPDGSIRYELAEGSNKLDLFVQDNNAIAGGATTLEVIVTFEDGSSWSSMIFN